MSKIIKEISAPVLNNPNFGDNLKEQFDNINTNFRILASAEFMKGVEGKTVKLAEAPAFVKNDENKYVFTNFGAKLFSTILNIEITENTELDVIKSLIDADYPQWKKLFTSAKYSVFDSFKTGDNTYDGTIKLYCYEDEETYIYSPMNYFRDARIDELNDSEADPSNFSDASCSYIYDGENFKTYTLYPTLYYNSTLGLICWKVNGKETSIAAQGLPGKDGNTCRMHIIKCECSSGGTNTITATVIKYFYGNGDNKDNKWHDINDELITYININEGTTYKSINDLFSRTDLYFCIIDDGNEIYDYTFCTNPHIDETGTIIFTIDNSSLIRRKSFLNNFKDMVNNFGVDSEGDVKHASLKGFYLPFSKEKLVHSIYNDSSNNDNLIIDIESKDVYTKNESDKYNDSIDDNKKNIIINNHDVEINSNLTVNDSKLTVNGESELNYTEDDNTNKIKVDSNGVDIEGSKNIKLETNGGYFALNDKNLIIESFENINLNYCYNTTIGNNDISEEAEPDKNLTIYSDTTVNVNGKLNIQGNNFNYYDYLPVGSTLEIPTIKYLIQEGTGDNIVYKFDYKAFSTDFKNWVCCEPLRINEYLDPIFNLNFKTYDNTYSKITEDDGTEYYIKDNKKYFKTIFFGIYLYNDEGDGELIGVDSANYKPFYFYFDSEDKLKVASQITNNDAIKLSGPYKNLYNIFNDIKILNKDTHINDVPKSTTKFFLCETSVYNSMIKTTGLTLQYVNAKCNKIVSSHYMIGIPKTAVDYDRRDVTTSKLYKFLNNITNLEDSYKYSSGSGPLISFTTLKLNAYFSYPILQSPINEQFEPGTNKKYTHAYKYITKIK